MRVVREFIRHKRNYVVAGLLFNIYRADFFPVDINFEVLAEFLGGSERKPCAVEPERHFRAVSCRVDVAER